MTRLQQPVAHRHDAVDVDVHVLQGENRIRLWIKWAPDEMKGVDETGGELRVEE